MYHIQFVQGTMAQTGHLAERIRVLHKPAQRHENLSWGWIVTESEGPLTEAETRAVLLENGVEYPADFPLVYGDYSISSPGWNAYFYQWDSQPDDTLPVWMQPRWWLSAHDDEFPCNPMGLDITLAEWKASSAEAVAQASPELITVQDIACEFDITPRRARAIAKNRHERFGIGQQLPGGQWVFMAYDLDILRPDPKYRAEATARHNNVN